MSHPTFVIVLMVIDSCTTEPVGIDNYDIEPAGASYILTCMIDDCVAVTCLMLNKALITSSEANQLGK